jgi:UDP-glucose 4-epimerase
LKDLYLSSYGVLVTGANGMIGKHLIPALMNKGHEIIPVDIQFGTENWENILIGDLLDDEFLNIVLTKLLSLKCNKKAVIHLAGISNVTEAKKDPILLAKINTLLTVKILSSVQSYGIDRFLFPSTGLVYGSGKENPITEDDFTAPGSVYAASKLAAECFIQGFASEKNLSCEIFRLSNVFASDSSEATVVGRIINQIRKGMDINVATRVPIRDFIFIDDVVEAICRLLVVTSQPGCSITNVSTGVGTSIGKLVDFAYEISNKIIINTLDDEKTRDCFVLSNALLYKRTGWKPLFSVNDGLRAILN